ncbi:hypothetical protein BBAL3_3429 [Brevundimonas sp. BAL3]|nr:hypothetical protein BBAL3_3429 [Brevundimonas sp. BAL3]
MPSPAEGHRQSGAVRRGVRRFDENPLERDGAQAKSPSSPTQTQLSGPTPVCSRLEPIMTVGPERTGAPCGRQGIPTVRQSGIGPERDGTTKRTDPAAGLGSIPAHGSANERFQGHEASARTQSEQGGRLKRQQRQSESFVGLARPRKHQGPGQRPDRV